MEEGSIHLSLAPIPQISKGFPRRVPEPELALRIGKKAKWPRHLYPASSDYREKVKSFPSATY